jgi:hypothetical protein
MAFMKLFGADIADAGPIFDETAEILGGIPKFPTLLPTLLVRPLGAV